LLFAKVKVVESHPKGLASLGESSPRICLPPPFIYM
jgi:hypothetical protein